MLTIPNSVYIIVEALYSYFLETTNGETIVPLKFRDEENVSFVYVIHACVSVILLRSVKNSSFENNTAQSWQVNSTNAA